MLGALFSVLFTPGVDPGAVTSAALLLAAGLGILLGAESIYRRRRSAFVKGSICRGEVKVLFRRRRIYRSRREIYARIEFEDQNGGLFATAAPAEGTWGSNGGSRSDARSPGAGNLAVGDTVLVAWDADSRTAFPLVSQVGIVDICEDS